MPISDSQKSLAALLLLLLSGCAGPAQLAATDANACVNYGFTPGTEAFAACRMKLDTQRADHRENRRRDILQSIPDQPLR